MSSKRLCIVAVLLYVPAWFLPAIRLPGESLGGGSTLGWDAFVLAVRPLLMGYTDVSPLLLAWLGVTAASNVVLVVGLGVVWFRASAVGRRLWWWLAIATVANAGWLPSIRELRAGYFLWLSAFVVGTLAARAAVREGAMPGGAGIAAA